MLEELAMDDGLVDSAEHLCKQTRSDSRNNQNFHRHLCIVLTHTLCTTGPRGSRSFVQMNELVLKMHQHSADQ